MTMIYKTEDKMTKPSQRGNVSIALMFILLTLTVVGCAPSAKLQSEFYRPKGISPACQKLFDEYRASIPERMKKHKIPGLSIAVVDREGILWTAGFGKTGRGNQPVTPETLFSIQSMSKTFTATAVMMAVQDGLVDLDTPITEYLPEFTVKSYWEDSPQQKITLRHLLSHTAGFTHEAPIGNNCDTRYSSFEEHVLSIQDTWLRCRVGEKYNYSNLGIDLAAYILQVKSGMPFEQYIKMKIFNPLGMPTSSVNYNFVKKFPDRALGHLSFVTKIPVAIPMVGAGGVYTSASELSRFVQFHLNRGEIGGRRILDANLIDTMDTSSPVSQSYGLCINIGKGYGTYYLAHGGGGFGFLTTMIWCPEYGIGCIVLTNSMNHDDQHVKISNEILTKLVTENIVTKDTSGDIPSSDSFIGKDMKLSPLPDNGVTFTPTPYKPQWKRYIGTYRFIYRGFKLHPIAKLVMALGYCPHDLKMTVVEKDGYLCIGDEKLYEYELGLFFTPSGEALDLRSKVPIWRSIKMGKSVFFWSL